MQGYPAYKESGFEWIGQIPSHWGIGKLGGCFEERNEKVSDTDYAALSVTKNGIVPQMEHVAKTDAGDNRKKVCINDFVINSRSDRKGSSGTSQYDGSVSLISTVLKPREYDPNFAHHLLRSYNFQEEFYRYGKGIVADLWSTRYAEMKSISVPLIPMEEQKAIATFLDRETARIDNLIAEKQNFINLLKEKRQALISHVVTKGLDPTNSPGANLNASGGPKGEGRDSPSSVKMKESGIEWIGEVPEHWKCGKLKYMSKISNGATPNRDTEEFWENGNIGWLNSSKVNDVVIREAEQFITQLALTKTSVQPVKSNDLVIAITGEGQTRGRVAICKTDATINQHLAAISVTDPNFSYEFLFYWLTSQYNRIRYESSGAGSTKGAITCSDIGMYPVPIPPLFEQKAIVKSLKSRLGKFDQILEETELSINYLKEHRTALISAAVTGKIDVREQQ